MRITSQSISLSLCGLLLVGCASNGAMSSKVAEAEFQCPEVIQPVKDIRANSYYSDAKRSVIDPVLHARYKANIEPITTFQGDLVLMADGYVANGDPKQGKCVVSWMNRWAMDGALLGEIYNERGSQANYIQKWALGTIAMAAFKVRDQINSADHAIIDPWLKAISVETLKFWDDPKHTRNNHLYWTTLGVAATAVVTDDAAMWKKTTELFDEALSHIPDSGILEHEMKRGQLAVHYHNYSLLPLSTIAELARFKGENWYQRGNGKLLRLAEVTADGLTDPSWFEKETGTKQKLPSPGNMYWTILFKDQPLRNKEKVMALAAKGPYFHTQSGGDADMTRASVDQKKKSWFW